VNDGNGGLNYLVTLAPENTGVITIANQTITFVTYPSGTVSGNSFNVTATSTSGLKPTFIGGLSGVCSVGRDGTVSLQGSGQCPVTAEQSGNNDYSAASDITKTFTITFNSVAASLASTDITNNGSSIGTLVTENPTAFTATLVTTGSGSCDGTNSDTSACHVLNVKNTVTNGPSLPAGDYGFTLTQSTVSSADLETYFVNKLWDPSWYPQINLEISGAAPFFYFVSDGNGNYSLADGFQYGLSDGKVIAPLVIDDNYPTRTYTFTGSVNGSPVTVTLTVTTTTSGFSSDHGTDLAQDSPAGITSDYGGYLAEDYVATSTL
jgi:hypothetical protein